MKLKILNIRVVKFGVENFEHLRSKATFNFLMGVNFVKKYHSLSFSHLNLFQDCCNETVKVET